MLYTSGSMSLPMLAPRPDQSLRPVRLKPQQMAAHTESEWEFYYPEIEKMYICERRKLRYVMQCMENKYGFKATEQMYKKRFAKWGFQKSSKRSAVLVRVAKTHDKCMTLASKRNHSRGGFGDIPSFPRLGSRDGLALEFLSRVRTWSLAFFEPTQIRKQSLTSHQRFLTGQLQPYNFKEINFAFKLTMDLLDRGRGELGGRMARKAFLLVERMLMLEGPALMWNLLEIMHQMVTLRNAQLFDMLLAHLIALVDRRMPKSHPLSALLRILRALVASPSGVVLKRTDSAPFSSSSLSSFSTDADKPMSAVNDWSNSIKLQSLLEQAWNINAAILFQHLDPRMLSLYYCVVWESCSIGPPARIFSTVNQWLEQIEVSMMPITAAIGIRAQALLGSAAYEEDKLVQRLLTPRMDASPPRDYEMHRTSSIATLREHFDSIFGRRSDFKADTTVILRMLAALYTAKILELWPTVTEPSDMADCVTTKVTRLEAALVACTMKTLFMLNRERGVGETRGLLDTVESVRAIAALRGFAEGDADPQAIRELWLLQDVLIAAGEYEKAREVEGEAYHRTEQYIQDIPVNFA